MMGARRIGHAVAVTLLGFVLVGSVLAPAGAQETTPPEAGSPEAFVRQLLTTPYSGETATDDEQAVIAVWNNPAYGFLDETVGAAQIIFPSVPDAALTYRVYPDETAAAAALARDTTENARTADATVSTPARFEAATSALVDAGSESICLVLIDNVVVTAQAPDGVLPPETSVVALAAMLVEHLNNVRSGSQPMAPPVGDGPLAGIDPWTLTEQLLAGCVATQESPVGDTDWQVEEWVDYNDTDLRGTVGGMLVSPASDPLTGIAYLVYPNQAAADYFFALGNSESVEMGATMTTATPAALDVPATIIAFDDYVVCVVQVGYVTIIGAADGGDADTAIALAAAGVTYLERVAAE